MKRAVLWIVLAGIALLLILAAFLLWRSPRADEATHPGPSAPVSGWCCIRAGNDCDEAGGGVLSCIQQGGSVFHVKRAECDRVCNDLQ